LHAPLRHHVVMGELIWSIVAVVASIAVTVGVVYALIAGRHDRDHEEEAREYYTRHGHWPDETPSS
jgi:hypothetical protein